MSKHLALVVVAACSSSIAPADQPDASPDAPRPPPGPRLIPGPSEPGHDAELAALAAAYDRQFHTFSAAPFGVSLDALVPDPGGRELIAKFLGQRDTDDFVAFTTAATGAPITVYDVVAGYDEHGDLGMLAGAAAAGDAFRYVALRDAGADATRARADLLAAIAAFHVASTITGTPGAIARGIKRLDEPGAPPQVEPLPATCPQAGDRSERWRADGSGIHPGWIYRDNTGKDQVIGYAFALGAFWDAVAGDPAIPQAIRDQLQADARALGASLMQAVPLGLGGSADLVVRDWRGCPTRHLDLNPRVVPIDGFDPLILAADAENQNGWNALAALGVVRTLYHVGGDPALGRYYYDELIGTRDFPARMVGGVARVRAMYQDTCTGATCFETNFSNVNMAFVAAYGLLRYETDPALRTRYEAVLQSELWDADHAHDGESIQQAFFNLLYSAFRTAGADAAITGAALRQLREFAPPPYFDDAVENCDAAELAAGSCLAIDGATRLARVAPNVAIAREPLPKRLRPPSNFEWRSDPRAVNGGGTSRLDPGGDFRAAYWLGRVLGAGPAGATNLSPVARARP